jgi:hypothetical protein
MNSAPSKFSLPVQFSNTAWRSTGTCRQSYSRSSRVSRPRSSCCGGRSLSTTRPRKIHFKNLAGVTKTFPTHGPVAAPVVAHMCTRPAAAFCLICASLTYCSALIHKETSVLGHVHARQLTLYETLKVINEQFGIVL